MKKKRTVGMTVIAALDCFFGFLGFVMASAGILSALAAERKAIVVEGSMGLAGATAPQQAAAANLLGMSLLSLVIATAAIAAGVALFLMWRRARVLNLAYAWLAMAKGVALFAFPVLSRVEGAALSLGDRAIGLLLGLIYPVVVILLFARPEWKAAFATAT
jgi:hypothetical protein